MKWFLKSKTVIGIILGILPALLPAFGVSLGEDAAQFISANVDAVLSGIGAALALYGRFVAKDVLSVKP